MGGYHLTTEARKDLTDIRSFTRERWGDTQSKKYLSELRETIRTLSNLPSMGKHRPDIQDGVYSFPYVSHTIYYTVVAKQMVIIGVLHNSMVPSNHLEDRAI